MCGRGGHEPCSMNADAAVPCGRCALLAAPCALQVILENMISPEPDRAVLQYQLRQDQKRALLDEKGIAEDHCKTE